MKQIIERIKVGVVTLVAMFVTTTTFAAYQWVGGVDSRWNTPGNWNIDGSPTQNVPGQWSTVEINVSGDTTIEIPQELWAGDTLKINGGGQVTFTGSGTMITHHISGDSTTAVFDVPVKLKDDGTFNWSFTKMNVEFKKPVSTDRTADASFNVSNTGKSDAGYSIVFRDVLTASTFNMNAVIGWAGDSQEKVKVEFYGQTSLKSFTVGNSYKSGYFHFYAAGNEIPVCSATYGQVFFHAENPLSDTASLAWNDYWNDSTIPGRYDFSEDATIGSIGATTQSSGAKRQITASSPATLTLKAAATASTTAILGTNLSFVYDPTVSACVQTFDLNESPIDGTVTVKGGKLQLATTAKFAALTALDVESGATFELAGTASGALASLQMLTVAGTFKVGSTSAVPVPNTCTATIPEGGVIDTAVDLALAGVIYKGVPVDFGTYESADWLSGSGKVTVIPAGGVEATYTWTGNAGNGNFGDSGNWDSAPVFDSTRTTFVIPQAAATIIVNRKVVAKKISFTSTAAGTVTLDATTGSGLTLCEGLVECAAAASVEKAVVINAPVEFITTLAISNGSDSDATTASNELRFTGKISSIGTGTITRSGFGTVYITGDKNTIYGDITANQGETVVAGEDPLGGSGTFLINRSHKLSRLTLDTAVVDRAVRSVRTETTDEPFIWVKSGMDNVINGKVSNKTGHARVWLADNTQLECKGGMDFTESNWVCYQHNANKNQTLIVSGAPIQNNNWFYGDVAGSKLVLNVAGNYTGAGTGCKWYYAGTIETGVDSAIQDNQTVEMAGSGVPVLDVKSTAQTFRSLYRPGDTDASGVFKPANKNGYVTGTAGGSLKLTGSADAIVLPPFHGVASFENAGTATRTMRRASSSTGTLIVSEGTLVLAAPGEAYGSVAQSAADFEGGAWTNGPVQVTGGTLRLNHAKALNKRQVLTLTGGTVEIPSGVTVTVGSLVVNGKEVDIGSYGAGSFSGMITGGGTLHNRGLHPGLILFVR